MQTERRVAANPQTKPVDLGCESATMSVLNKVSSRGCRDDMGPGPMAVRLAADLRPTADGTAVRTSPAAAKLQAASVTIA